MKSLDIYTIDDHTIEMRLRVLSIEEKDRVQYVGVKVGNLNGPVAQLFFVVQLGVADHHVNHPVIGAHVVKVIWGVAVPTTSTCDPDAYQQHRPAPTGQSRI